jgi:hypothetical protein
MVGKENLYAEVIFRISDEKIMHKKEAQQLANFLGNIAGLQGLIFSITGFFISNMLKFDDQA